MGSPSIPAAPAAPDYGTANKTAIETDISTLPLRNSINQAAQLGQKITYKDPVTGEDKTADFTGMGNAAAAQQAATILADTNAAVQRQQLGLRQELGVGNVQQTIKELEAADPQGYALRQDLTKRAGDELNAGKTQIAPSDTIRAADNNLRKIAGNAPTAGRETMDLYRGADGALAPRLGSIYDEATRLPGAVKDDSTAALNTGLQRAMQEFQLGGKLGTDEKRDLLNEVRAGQAARGNYLGDGAAVAEQMELGSASEARKAARLKSLLDIQGQAFGQNTQLRGETAANSLNRVNTMAGLEGQRFGQEQGRVGTLASLDNQSFGQNQQAYTTGLNAAQAALASAQTQTNDSRASRQEGFAYDQQRLGNAQSLALGAPVTNQFGALGGAQQGAVGFTPVNYQQVGQVNQNAGAQGANFAQSSFGTNSSNWNKSADIASQGNPWMSLLGNVAGAAAGAGMAAMI